MNGLTIFSHSFRQVSGNLGMAIKVSGWLVVIYAIGVAVALSVMPDWLVSAMDSDPDAMMAAADFSSGSVGFVSMIAILAMVFLLWSISLVAIVWHRYILLEETPRGVIPYRPDFRVGRYFWLGLGIMLLAVLVVALIGGFLGVIFGPFLVNSMGGLAQAQTGGMSGTAFLMGLVVGIIVVVLYLRMALVLPAIALDENLTIRQAWERTSGYTGAIFTLALILAFINAVVPLVLSIAFSELVWVNIGLSGLYQWFYFMLNISVLSTLYGLIVQKREVY